ncbi:flavin reductase family protein [Microbacterium sp. LWH3-1.2]|uniref:flavin reductase family protein n=1 Tax=Microbacterium sp. LWH3-1.2 TaxID=3135256 RepID=UPI003438151C
MNHDTNVPARPISPDPSRAVDPMLFRDGMRKLASGVALVTTRSDAGPAGLAATAVSSVSFDPPSLLVCVNKSASAHDPIVTEGRFTVNVLSTEHGEVLDAFARSRSRAERFAHADWGSTASGLPSLTTALAVFECSVTQRLEYGTHSIIVGNVVDASNDPGATEPMIYLDRQTRALAVAPS